MYSSIISLYIRSDKYDNVRLVPINYCGLTVTFCPLEQLAPAYEGVELGIGDAVLQKAIVGATGRSAKDVRTHRGFPRHRTAFSPNPQNDFLSKKFL